MHFNIYTPICFTVAEYFCEVELSEDEIDGDMFYEEGATLQDSDSEGSLAQNFDCKQCGNCYKSRGSLNRHLKYECQIEPSYECLVKGCQYKGKYPVGVKRHMARIHPDFDIEEVQREFFS